MSLKKDINLDLQYFCLDMNRLGMYTWSFTKAEIKKFFPEYYKEWLEYKEISLIKDDPINRSEDKEQ